MGNRSKRMFVQPIRIGRKPRDTKAAKHERFLKEYAANPCNFLPGAVLLTLYRRKGNQLKLQAEAAKWIAAHNERAAREGFPRIDWHAPTEITEAQAA